MAMAEGVALGACAGAMALGPDRVACRAPEEHAQLRGRGRPKQDGPTGFMTFGPEYVRQAAPGLGRAVL